MLTLVCAGAWVWSDTSWGGLPPASLVRAPLAQWLPEPVSGLATLLPTRDAPRVDTAALPDWAPPPATARNVSRKADSPAALREAMAQALPGDVIELQPGDHPVTETLYTGNAGRPGAPIVLRGSTGARLLVNTVEAIKLTQPHWVIEHLEMVGNCANVASCEHAMHVVGQAHDTMLYGLQLRDFNAAIKVNGEGGAWPDRGRVSHSLLANRAPRPGDAPATPFDLVGASEWRFEDNRILGVAKVGGDGVAYGAFMKGGGQGGHMERNLIVCAPQAAFVGVGRQVGLSFGGGRTDPGALRDKQTRLEHIQGVASGNVVLNCNDTALDVNESDAIELRDNIALGSGGILVRGQASSARALDNVVSRPLFAMPGNELVAQRNRRMTPTEADARQLLKTLRLERR
ncbi:MAG: hypothetical protein EOP39_08795 [Rubrivivax sp.]|nr:MAG: hypothetical protein EOP39_08795 [Rubrivivax sp.]